MRLKKVDQTILLLGMMLIIISFYQLFIFKSSGSQNLKKLGTLSMTRSVVKTKNALALDWRDGLMGSDLSESQLIYTDSDSSADVIFLDGIKVSISENSLVKLKSNGVLTGFDVNKGFIRAKVNHDKPLIVNMNGQEYALTGNGAEIQVNFQEKKGEIGVLSGDVVVESKNLKENLSENIALGINGDKTNKKIIAYKLLTPGNNQKIYTLEEEVNIHFTWSPVESVTLELSKNANFDNLQKFESISEYFYKISPGQYFVKLTGEKGTSLINSFNVIQEKSPKILRPIDKSKIDVIEVENGEPVVTLQWLGDSSLNYLVEWIDDENHSQIVSANQIQIPISSSKSFKWRVKIEDSERPLALWSPWHEIEVNLIAQPGEVKDIKPDGEHIQIFDENEKINLNWRGNGLSEIEVIDPEGKILKSTLDVSNYNYPVKNSGEYRFRVRGRDVFKRVGPWSDWKTFQVENLSHDINEDIQRIILKRPDQEVKFSWNKNEKNKTVFELSKVRDFSKVILKKEVDGDTTSVIIPEIGDFYWRSQEITDDGSLKRARPKRVIISPTPAPSKPEKLPDIEVPLKWKELKLKKTSSIFDLFISDAYAEDFTEVAHLEVPKHEDAKFYLIKVYRDPNFKELILEKKLTTNQFEWVGARAGVYYWQHAIIDYWGRQSLFSDPALLTITGGDVLPPEPVKLLFPIKLQNVQVNDLELNWRSSPRNINYEWEIARDVNFENIIKKEMTNKLETSKLNLNLPQGLYYWRVKSFNKKGDKSVSNVGRFTIVNDGQSSHEVVIWIKNWRSRASVAFAPSKDSYTFSKNELKGTIDGIAKYGIEAKGTIFWNSSILNAEFLRQSGKVFKGENYLFQRFLVDWIKSWGGGNHRFGLGFGIGTSSGMGYDINSAQTKVIASGVSGASYGPVLRSYHSFSEKWEIQNKFGYYAGAIPQMEIGAEFLKHGKSNYLIFGISQSVRGYSLNKGSQSSSRLVLGIGKEF